MFISRGAYEGALKKLSLPQEVLYDERGIIRPENVLTADEKNALLYYIQNDSYYKKENPEEYIDIDVQQDKYFK